MATLEEMKAEYAQSVASAIHLMLIAPTKHGKSDYVAQAAKDGFDVIYFDNDNGLATLMELLKDDPEALARVRYYSPVDFTETIEMFLRAPAYRYNERTNKTYASHEAKPDDIISIFYPRRIGLNRNVLVSIDSWTTLCFDALKDAANNDKKDVMSLAKWDRDIYGPSGFKMTQIAQILQLAPFSFIVQAHPAVYEIKEKPAGNVAREIQEKDMIIKETWEIPMSTSNPHGFSIGKYFNNIGWIELDRWDKFKLSFKPKARRIVGGSISTEGDPRTTHRYSKLFGGGLQLPQPMPADQPWLERITAEELAARTKKPAAAASAAPASNQPATATPQLQTTGLKLGGVKLGG